MSIDNLFTPEQIEALKNGELVGGSINSGMRTAGVDVYEPSTSVPISGYDQKVKPIIKDKQGVVVSRGLVTKPDLSKHQQAHDKKMAAERLEWEKEKDLRAKHNAALAPDKLLATLNALDRKVKKLEKQLKEFSSNDV